MRAADTTRWGLERAREVIRYSLSRRDRFLPSMAEMRNLTLPGPGGPLEARLYVPKTAVRGGPLLVYFHGGGFVTGDLDTHDSLCARLADAGGFRLLSCAYRLAPEHPFPAQVEDALAFSRWAISHARRLGSHPRRIGIGGDSAGGYLAITTAARMPRAFTGQVLIYPLMHLEDDVWSDAMVSNSRIVGRLAVRFIDQQLGDGGVRAPSLLAEGALRALPTLIVAGGALDPCRPDAKVAKDRLEAGGAPVTYRDYPGLIHGFGNLGHLSPAARKAVIETGKLAGELLSRR